MTYKLSAKADNITVSLSSPKLVTKVESPEYTVSLSRTGGQGAKGDSITDVFLDENKHLIVEVTASNGTVTQLDAGSFFASLDEIQDVVITNVSDGDYLAYDVATQTYKNHKLTTSRVADINNTNKEDGALLVYNGTTQKYTATKVLNNANTIISGGDF